MSIPDGTSDGLAAGETLADQWQMSIATPAGVGVRGACGPAGAWARLNDFETTFTKDIERIAQQKGFLD